MCPFTSFRLEKELSKSKEAFSGKKQMLLSSLKQKEKELLALAQDVDRLTSEKEEAAAGAARELADAKRALKRCGSVDSIESDGR